ncbi:hypothetical protein FRACYDRAFT_267100, partial [Fragilariopsis cylindrus CCMP1102]
MVPPKQIGHNVIQLEAPLQECCSCLVAIAAKLQLGSNSNYTTATGATTNIGNEEKEQHNGPKSPTSPSKNSKNSTNTNNSKANPNSKPTNNFSITLVIQPLPSQTKLRNIARKTETKILKKRMSKYQQQKHQEQHPQQQHSEQTQKASEDNNEGDQQQQQQDGQQEQEQPPELQSGESDTKEKNPESWRLTIVANTEKKATKALEMLKVLNTKGYGVDVVKPVSESNRVVNLCDGSTHCTGDRDCINESA